jgi:hypothetical protein
MPAHNTGGLDAAAEYAVVIRLLEDHTQPVSRAELYTTRSDIGAVRLEAAIIQLVANQLVLADESSVRSAPALQHLDELRLIAI